MSPQPQHHVVNRNILRGYPVVLKGTENHADTKMSELGEPDLFFPSIKYKQQGHDGPVTLT